MSKILSAFLNSILLNHVGNPSRLDPRARILLPSALPCLANKNRAKRERPALASSSRNRWITPIHGFNVRHSSTDFSSDYSKTGGERRLILRGEGEGVSMTRSIECVGLKWIIAKSKRYFEGFRRIRVTLLPGKRFVRDPTARRSRIRRWRIVPGIRKRDVNF